MKRRDGQTRRERGRRTEQGRTDDEGIIYGRGKESGGQNNSEDGRDAKSDTHTRTDDRRTDGGPKVGKRSEKSSKISRCRTELQFPHLIRTRVREANEETKADFGGLGDMTVRWPTARRGAAKKWTEDFGFLSPIYPNPTTKCVFHV